MVVNFRWLIWLVLIGFSNLLVFNVQAGSTLSAGIEHVCGIKDDSTLICWGDNKHNQANPPEGTFTQVSAGYKFNCAVRVDGSIACWGLDTNGETSPPPGRYIQVEAGTYHACALTNDGTPTCWGSDNAGQVSFLTSNKFQQLALGHNHSCGLKPDSTIECWGGNSEGQSTDIDDKTFSSIAAGYYTTCGIKTDGIVTCWGENNRNYGYLTQTEVSIYANNAPLCGLKTDYTVSCPSMSYTPNDRFTYIASDYNFGCGIKEDGIVVCWGGNSYGKATPPEDTILKTGPIPSSVTSCTQLELDNAYDAGISACKINPTFCDITTEANVCPVDNNNFVVKSCPKIENEQVREEGKSEGIATCRTNPASCGIIHIPTIETSFGTYLSFEPNKKIDSSSNSVFYNVGDLIEINLTENFQQASRFENVDLWIIIELPNTNLVYKTPVVLGGFSPNPQPFRETLDSTQTTHRILEFEVVEGLGGDYTFSAVYVEKGKNPMTDGFFIQRSNVARLDVVLRNR